MGRGEFLQADLPRLYLLGQPGGVHGGLEQVAHRLQPPPLFGQLGLLLLQQGQQRLGAAAGEIVPDLRQGGAQAAEGRDEVIGPQLLGGVIPVAVLPHPLGFQQANVVVVEEGVLPHPAQGGKLRGFKVVVLHGPASRKKVSRTP